MRAPWGRGALTGFPFPAPLPGPARPAPSRAARAPERGRVPSAPAAAVPRVTTAATGAEGSGAHPPIRRGPAGPAAAGPLVVGIGLMPRAG
ncbi:hypothetical protein GCM10019016_070460 [Streptomyces prasinosporus]|uniref:Uncharacterized protein n=1 Tax=Streptomyces prasinosporus TaxID=68256 RepID=A0ABP6TX52_9ACTN